VCFGRFGKAIVTMHGAAAGLLFGDFDGKAETRQQGNALALQLPFRLAGDAAGEELNLPACRLGGGIEAAKRTGIVGEILSESHQAAPAYRWDQSGQSGQAQTSQ
jgi:hypothetical protein